MLCLHPINELSDIIQVFFTNLRMGSPLYCLLVLTSWQCFACLRGRKCKHWRCKLRSQVDLGLYSNTSLSRYLALKNLQLFYVLFSSFVAHETNSKNSNFWKRFLYLYRIKWIIICRHLELELNIWQLWRIYLEIFWFQENVYVVIFWVTSLFWNTNFLPKRLDSRSFSFRK